MSVFEFVLILATWLCGLTAGFLFAFASVVMPGIGKLDDKAYIRAFQVIDGVIQAGQPVFGVVWLGSALAILMAGVMAFLQPDGILQILVCTAALAHLFGVQLPTFRINVPLNNALQSIDTDAIDEAALAAARRAFEPRWVTWNSIRTVIASMVSVSLMCALLWL